MVVRLCLVFVACFCFVVLGSISAVNTGKYGDAFLTMKRLFKDLLDKGEYNRLVAPIGQDGRALTVTFDLDIKRLLSLDIESQVLRLDAVMSMMWYDNQLQWNPNHYGNISIIRLPNSIVWQPDMILYNSADQQQGRPNGDINVVITFDGHVVYSPRVKTNSFCSLPNSQPKRGDFVTCSLKFGSWAYDGLALNVTPAGLNVGGEDGVEYYVDMLSLETDFNRQWEVVSTSVTRNRLVYPCCPEPYIDIVYKVMMKCRGVNNKLGFPTI